MNEYREETVDQDFQPAWNFIDVLFMAVAAVILFLLGIGAISLITGQTFFGPEEARLTALLSALLGALEGIALIGGVYFAGLLRRNYTWREVGLRPIGQKWVVWSILLGMVVIPLSGLIALLIQVALDRPLENPQLPFLAPEGFSWFALISMLLLGGLVAPFAEELFFRGVLYQWLRDRWGIWPGIIVSGLLFGALHGELSVAGAAAVLGFILAWIYERSRSLWPAVLVHAINNSFKIILLYFMLASGMLPPVNF